MAFNEIHDWPLSSSATKKAREVANRRGQRLDNVWRPFEDTELRFFVKQFLVIFVMSPSKFKPSK